MIHVTDIRKVGFPLLNDDLKIAFLEIQFKVIIFRNHILENELLPDSLVVQDQFFRKNHVTVIVQKNL